MKRTLLILSVMLLLIFTALPASAEVYSGDCSCVYAPSVTWTFDDATGTLTVSGNGTMTNDYYYYQDDYPWYEYCDAIKSLVIEEGVTTVGNHAFYYCRSLTEVTFPEGLQSIGNYAFNSCDSLTEVTFPEGLQSIGDYAFWNCDSLTEVTFPEGLQSIGTYAFNSCVSLTEVTFPEGLQSIGDSAFYSCYSLTEVTFPESLQSIGRYAFCDCDSLTEVTFSDGLQSIGDSAFDSCNSLFFISFWGDAPTTGGNVFDYCHDDLTIYYNSAKEGWTTPEWNGYRTVSMDEITDFSTLDEENCNPQGIYFTLNDAALTAVVGDNSGYENNSGYGGANNRHVVIPDVVTKDGNEYAVIGIGRSAFAESLHLRSIEIGKNVSSIDATAFRYCYNLGSFTVDGDSKTYSASKGVLYDAVKYQLYRCPPALESDCFTVPSSVRTIGTSAFADCKGIKEIVVKETVTAIQNNAFPEDGLEKITLPFIGRTEADSASDRFDDVFYDDDVPDTLETVIITGGSLGEGAFFNCGGIRSISLPMGITEIPERCFSYCSSLESLTFEGKEPVPGVLAIPDGVTMIDSLAFVDCKRFTKVQIPTSLTEIENTAFSGCTGLESFEVASGNTAFSNDRWGVLFNKNKTELVLYPAGRLWPYYNVPESVETVNQYSFDQTQNLVNLFIPETVSTIRGSAVCDCPGATLCVYLDSPAARYGESNGLNVWYMDNYTAQGIRVYSLPEQNAIDINSKEIPGLYMAVDYGGKLLQLEEYDVSYSGTGLQQVSVTGGEFSTSFPALLYDSRSQQVLEFTNVNAPDGTLVMIALYDNDGRMMSVQYGTAFRNSVSVVLENTQISRSEQAKLFLLQAGSLAPLNEAVCKTL